MGGLFGRLIPDLAKNETMRRLAMERLRSASQMHGKPGHQEALAFVQSAKTPELMAMPEATPFVIAETIKNSARSVGEREVLRGIERHRAVLGRVHADAGSYTPFEYALTRMLLEHGNEMTGVTPDWAGRVCSEAFAFFGLPATLSVVRVNALKQERDAARADILEIASLVMRYVDGPVEYPQFERSARELLSRIADTHYRR